MAQVPEELAFRVQTGATARSLDELRAALEAAPASVAFYHREHLVPWVRDVVRDVKLARRLEAYAATPDPDAYRDILLRLLARG